MMTECICTVEYGGERVALQMGKYRNDRPALLMVSSEGEPYGALSVNLPDAELPEGLIAIKNWSENEELAALFFKTGKFEDTGMRVQTGFVSAPVWRMTQ